MGEIIIDTNDKNYRAKYNKLDDSAKHNGAYYYSKTFEEDIAPFVKTDRPWNLMGFNCCGGKDKMIVVIHNNLTAKKDYMFLKRYKDVVCISNVRKTANEGSFPAPFRSRNVRDSR